MLLGSSSLVMNPVVSLVPDFRDMHLPGVLARQDNITRPWSTSLATEIVLKATPFNRLSIWAYLAFTFIVVAVSTVLAYMTYTCCYSARRQYYGTETRAARRIGAIRLNSTKRNSNHWIRGGRYTFSEEKGETVAKDGKRHDAKEKDGLERFRIERTDLGMKNLGFYPKSSESQENIVQNHSNISHNSYLSTPEHSFFVESHYVTSPPLAYTNERSAVYIPFHLPPPPSSPTPAYKEFLERQKQLYRGEQVSYSPVSPSPSLFPDRSPPNLFKASILSSSQQLPKNHRRGEVATTEEPDQSTSAFDSNNIRYASPHNPFMTPSTIFRWNDPKLSPVAGSIITSSPMRDSGVHFLSQATPSFNGNKATRLISPQQVSEPGGNGYGYQEKDNLHPISRACFEQQDNRF